MSASAIIRGRGRLTLASSSFLAVVAACVLTAGASAARPLTPPVDPGIVCPEMGPTLKVKSPSKPISSPARVRIHARVGGVNPGECFYGPMRVCVRTSGRAERDLALERRCFRRGGPDSLLSKKVTFTIDAPRRAEGRYRVVVRATPIRPRGMYRVLITPTAKATLTFVRG